MNKQDAKKIATKYTDKSTHVHVTADGNVFFQPQKNYAVNHSRKQKIELFSFTNEELGGKEVETPEVDIEAGAELGNEIPSFEEMTKNELIDYCNENGYPVGEYENLKTKAAILEYVKSKAA